MGTLERQAGIVGVYNKLARIHRLLLYFIRNPFVYLSAKIFSSCTSHSQIVIKFEVAP